jgi:imidazolonepropionase-like amidohydrolase
MPRRLRFPAPTLAIRGARILPSPGAAPIEHGAVVLHGDRIHAVGTDVAVPADAPVVDAEGLTLTAGFWNCHVHFTEPKWGDASSGNAATLGDHLASMLTSRGFTTVVDAGSNPLVTVPLRARVLAREVPGPAILTAGSSVFPPGAIPFYVRDELTWWQRYWVPEPATPAAARRAVAWNASHGSDLLKLFTGSYVARGQIVNMSEEVASAAVAAAHARRQLVFSHPSNVAGVEIARRSGVDVLAHPPDTTEGADESLVRSLVDRGMAMTPTLKMFETTVSTARAYLDPIDAIVRRFHELGGQLLFGTDVGYMADYRTEEEFRALTRCGLDGTAILAMLTTAPAARFGRAAVSGTVAPGRQGDVVLLDGDPTRDLGAFSRVVATVRAGRVIYRASASHGAAAG